MPNRPQDEHAAAATSRRRFQFRLVSIFKLTTCAAILTAFCMVAPNAAWVVLAYACVLALVYALEMAFDWGGPNRDIQQRAELIRCHALMQEGKYDLAWELLDQIPPFRNRDLRAAAHNTRGNLLALRGQFEAALAEFNEAVRLERLYPAFPLANRGEACLHLGRYQQAVDDCTAALLRASRDSDAHAYFNRGRARLRLGDHTAALGDFDEALRLAPQFAPALAERSLALEALGRTVEAQADCAQALAIDPSLTPGSIAVVYRDP